MKILSLFGLVVFLQISVPAQSHIIVKGQVSDYQTGEALQYANVILKNSSLGTTTNENGLFSLALPEGYCELSIGYIGYKTETITLGQSDTVFSVKLIPVAHLLSEVSVYSGKIEKDKISTEQLQNKQVEEYAGMTKDALRSVQMLPGVSTNNEATANFNVRGGSYDENLVLVNGVHVNEPFHLKEVSNAGISIFNIDMVKKIDFSAGGFSAENGDALSSILKVEYKEGDRERYSGRVNLSFVDLGVIADGPATSNSSFVFGARRSYLTQLLKMAGAEGDFDLSYHDIQGIYTYRLSNANKLKFTFIYSGDDFGDEPAPDLQSATGHGIIYGQQVTTSFSHNSSQNTVAKYSNYLFALSSVNLISSGLSNSITVSYYNENSDEDAFRSTINSTIVDKYPQFGVLYTYRADIFNRTSNKTFAAQTSFDLLLNNYNTLSLGANYERINYSIDKLYSTDERFFSTFVHFPDTTNIIYPKDPELNIDMNLVTPVNKIGGYIQDALQINDNFFITAGLRADYFDMNKSFLLSPRLNLSYITPWGVIVRGAYGIFYQTPNYKQLKYGYATSDNTKDQKAEHYIIGFENRFSELLDLKIEGYIKRYSDLIPVQLLADGTLDYGTKENRAKGYARGIDVQLIANLDWWTVHISYGYLVSKERIKGSDVYYSRYTDQTHTLSFIADLDAGKNWKISLRSFYGSGYAFPSSYLDKSTDPPQWKADLYKTDYLPSYEREDLRISKEFTLFNRPMMVYLDVMNLFGNRNVVARYYTYDNSGNVKKRDAQLFPTIPSLGLAYNL